MTSFLFASSDVGSDVVLQGSEGTLHKGDEDESQEVGQDKAGHKLVGLQQTVLAF